MFADVTCWELSFVENARGSVADEFFRVISWVSNDCCDVCDNLFLRDFR